MLKPYYKSNDKNFTLLKGDCIELLDSFDFEFDMIFADPPYHLSNDGISIQSGKPVSVNKGSWDKSKGFEEDYKFDKKWLSACREHLKPDGTIWVSGTYHNIFSVARCLTELNFKNPQLHHLGENQSSAQSLVPLLYLFGRIYPLGSERTEGCSLL